MNFKPLHIFGLVGFCGAIAAANPMDTMNAMAATQGYKVLQDLC